MPQQHLIPEVALQQIWAEQDFERCQLKTVCGQLVEVQFPGWHNTASGADFQECRILLDGRSLYGSIEIHLQSSDWFTHQHQLNPDYNSVILHVVLFHKGSRKPQLENGLEIPELELAPFFAQNREISESTAKERLKLFQEIPGRCGVVQVDQPVPGITKILGHAAEQRIQEKASLLQQRWHEQPPEELLFQLIFKSLGYSAYAQVFEELAKLYPLAELKSYFHQTHRNTRNSVLSRWFGACRLFETEKAIAEPTIRHEYLQWKMEWEKLSNAPQISQKRKISNRPQNSPERRLLGMYHHLQKMSAEALLKNWLLELQKLGNFLDDAELKKKTTAITDELFWTPDWEMWQYQFALKPKNNSNSMQLIGKDRHIIIWANALIPFFLTYARQENELHLEKLLYRLFMILPAEASNSKTRFMEKRLWISRLPKPLQKQLNSFGNRQGLIQLHHDFCRNFHQGCQNCELPGMLETEDIK